MGIKRCREAFALMTPNGPRVLNPGTLVDENDPVVAENPDRFEDVETYVSDRAPKVEQASAAPGEKRSVRPAGRRAPAKEEKS